MIESTVVKRNAAILGLMLLAAAIAIIATTISKISRRIQRQAIDAAKASDPRISHVIVGRWTAPIDGNPGYVREYRSNGAAVVWWPDGKLAASGKFFVVDSNTVAVDYPNRDTDVVRLLETNVIQINHVQYGGQHFKFYAERK